MARVEFYPFIIGRLNGTRELSGGRILSFSTTQRFDPGLGRGKVCVSFSIASRGRKKECFRNLPNPRHTLHSGTPPLVSAGNCAEYDMPELHSYAGGRLTGADGFWAGNQAGKV